MNNKFNKIKKSIAINVSLQAEDKTLSDNDLNQISEKNHKRSRK